ncbi:hypothetical protein D7322_08610 [Sphingobacterium puteale]|uniref:DNA-binding protein n=1 Tax=Sphingobacterium puteale TaxID=2420510 RepID=A0A420W0P7_9SPHI|nr:helix-turn-helix domain-containing protein [Sphingobacterium puteale]RKO72142.1 hypothetical protein D7322_08610 [Sphingobacterium puteale]
MGDAKYSTPIWDFGGMSPPKDQCMFFSNGHPSCQGSSYRFACTTVNFPNTRFVYSFKQRSTALFDTDLYYQKLDRVLELLQDQHYSELNKIMGTMTITEVASYLSKSVRTIERRIAKGFLKAAYKEGNADLFLKKDVVQLYISEYKRWPRQMP